VIDAIDIAAIRPGRGLVESSDCLDDLEELGRRYADQGYLFFRGLVPANAAEATRLRMARVLMEQGMIDSTVADARWIGGETPSLPEESPLFAGICPALFECEDVLSQFERLLGEPVSMVPNVLYRAYKPQYQTGPVHQDGVFNPGAEGYRSLWIALSEIDEEVGGMVLAPGHHRAGSLHDPKTGFVPVGSVPESAWAREDYRPGDVVVLHGMTPHGGLPNRSNRIRYSLDTRVQSAANPTVLQGELATLAPDRVTLRTGEGEAIEVALDAQSMLRFGTNGTPVSFAEFAGVGMLGRQVMATREGGVALMLRHASMG